MVIQNLKIIIFFETKEVLIFCDQTTLITCGWSHEQPRGNF